MEVINKGILRALEMLGLGGSQPQQGGGVLSAVAGMPRPGGKPPIPTSNAMPRPEGKPPIPTSNAMPKSKPPVVNPAVNIIESIITNEGGFQQDKADTGNYVGNRLIGTKYGITPKKLAEFENVDTNTIRAIDIENLSIDKAKEIYNKDIKNFKISQYPVGLQEQVFDIFTNFGYVGGLKVIQDASNVKTDGKYGPETKKAVQTLTPEKLVASRIKKYNGIVKNNPSQEKFLKGWLNRAKKYGR